MRYIWLVICILSVSVAFGQSSSKIKQLENRRKAALAEIEVTNQLLNETRQTARNSLNRLNLLSKQILSRKKVIEIMNQEIGTIDSQMEGMNREINKLQKELGGKRRNYGKSVQSLYKRHNSQDQLLFILSANTFAQSLRRMRYLREYADWQKRQATEIIDKQQDITRKKQELERTRSAKQALLGTREVENKKLVTEESSKKDEVKELSKKQKDLQASLKKKKRQADALNRQIEQQIAEEIARAEAEARAARERAERAAREERERLLAKEKADAAATANKSEGTSRSRNKAKSKTEPISRPVVAEPIREERVADTKGGYAMTREEKRLSDNFAGNQGRLPYPVTGRHTIVASFGEQQHQELKYVRTNNSGIDIQTSPGGEACAVFNGEVTRVFVVPGYNNSIIIRHGNYLTVYSNLSDVYVKAGDRVSTRQTIGKIFSDPEDGNSTILHFQLWKEKNKLNPAPWLD